MENLAKILIVVGLFLLFMGGVLFALSKFSLSELRLPGDIFYRGEKVTFYFPIVTCLIISVILTLVLNLFFRR